MNNSNFVMLSATGSKAQCRRCGAVLRGEAQSDVSFLQGASFLMRIGSDELLEIPENLGESREHPGRGKQGASNV